MSDLLPCPAIAPHANGMKGLVAACESCPNRRLGTVDVEALRFEIGTLASLVECYDSEQHEELAAIKSSIYALLARRVPTARELVEYLNNVWADGDYESAGSMVLLASEWLSAKEKEGGK